MRGTCVGVFVFAVAATAHAEDREVIGGTGAKHRRNVWVHAEWHRRSLLTP